MEFIISQRFQKLAPGLFQQSVEKMSLANLPSFASPEFHQRSTSPFASNLTATWGEFFNEAHIDNDVNSISYGGWCGINEKTGQPASWDDGFDIQYGQFFHPGISNASIKWMVGLIFSGPPIIFSIKLLNLRGHINFI